MTAVLLAPASALAQSIQAPYDVDYTVAPLGAAPGVPFNYGAITFDLADPDTMLIAGQADTAAGTVYRVGVRRDAGEHIVGYTGTASVYASAPFVDGGLTFGPDRVLFYTRYPANEIGQILPGSPVTNKVVALGPIGVRGSVGTLRFVPEGFPGAGALKTVSYAGGDWNDLPYERDADGTYVLGPAERRGTLSGRPEGLVYIPLDSPGFAAPSVAVCEYAGDVVSTFQVDGRGDAVASTRRVFVSGVPGAMGAAIDPVTNDLLFTTFSGSGTVLVVRGFAAPESDSDGDGVTDDDDNCTLTANPDQRDTDADGAGDACDDDDDDDGYADAVDAFPTDPLEHADADGDGVGDRADACPFSASNDGDGDGICSDEDRCPDVFDPAQADFDRDGFGDLCDPDWDGDGVSDIVDRCIGFNDAVDGDGDGIPDGPDANGQPCDICPADEHNDADADGLCADRDVCPTVADPGQADFDGDGAGDACDDDDDNDGALDLVDVFPLDPTEDADTDLDGVGDNADFCLGDDGVGDTDLDGVCDNLDTFPADPREVSDKDGDGVGDNADAFDDDPTEWDDTDLDGVGDNGDACLGDDATGDTDGDLICDDTDVCPTDSLDVDVDGDLFCDVVDTCAGTSNVDVDGDQICDELDLCLGNDATGDTDLDGVCDASDNCPVDPNADQADADGDGVGDPCEADSDNDGVFDDEDGCPTVFDPDQADADLDGSGDACDPDDDDDGVSDVVDNCPLLPNVGQLDSDLDGIGDDCDGDDDADGVLDLVDHCPGTPMNLVFDAQGCSGLQRIDLVCGPNPCSYFPVQVRHLVCVVHQATAARKAGLLTSREKAAVVKDAVRHFWCRP